MFFKLIWCFFCVLLFIYNLQNLNAKNKEFFFSGKGENLTNKIYFSLCLRINSNEYDCSISGLFEESKKECKRLKDYFSYIENNEAKSPKEILNKFNFSSLFSFKESEHYQIENKEKYMYLNHTCFLYHLNLIESHIKDQSFDLEIINKYFLDLRTILHSFKVPLYERQDYLICEKFKSCNFFTVKVRQIYKKSLPSYTGCFNYSNKKFSFGNFESKRECFQSCIKLKYRSFDFYYSEEDDKIIEYNKNYTSSKPIDEKHKKECKKLCAGNECEEIFYFLYAINQNNNSLIYNIDHSKFSVYEELSFEPSEYYRSIFVLISLFFKISILSLILKASSFARIKLKNKLLLSLTSILLWSSLILTFLLGCLSGKSNLELFLNKTIYTGTFYPNIPVKPANFSIAICKTVKLDEVKHSSLEELRKNAEALHLWKLIKVKFNQDRYYYEDSIGIRYFLRIFNEVIDQCFSLDFNHDEPKWKSLLSMTKLVINTTVIDQIYLEQYNKSITTKSLRFDKEVTISKIEDQSGKAGVNCKNYDNILSEDNRTYCFGRQNCIDICFLKTYLNTFHKLPTSNALVYFDYFEENIQKYVHFDHEKNKENESSIRNKCEELHKDKDCNSVVFIETEESYKNKKFSKEFSLDIFFYQFVASKAYRFDLINLVNSFISLSTILTGLCWPKLSRSMVFILNILLKYTRFKEFNFKNLFFFISISGSLVHAYFILQHAFNRIELKSSMSFNFSQPNRHVPTLIFCLEYNLTLKNNEVLTGNLLNEKTRNLNEKYLFSSIMFYDSELKKKEWKPEKELTEKNLEIEHFYLLNYKCFQINYKMNYNLNKNREIDKIIEIKFRANLTHQKYLFTSKQPGTDDFSNNFECNFKEQNKIYFKYYHSVYYDHYQTLRTPKLWFQKGYKINDPTYYMIQLREDFKSINNSTTNLIPLYKKDFNLVIDNFMFEQFNFLYIKEKLDSGLFDLNYERSFFVTKKFSIQSDFPSLSVDKIYYTLKSKHLKNNELFRKFLNMMFLWYNFCLLDMLDFISKMFSFLAIFAPKKLYKQFSEIKNKIDIFFTKKQKINPILSLNNRNISKS